MPISKYFKGEGQKVMKSMKKRYGANKGKSVFYATAQRGMKGSGPFTPNEQTQGYKVMFNASDLHKLSVEHEHMGHMMAKRRMSMHKGMM